MSGYRIDFERVRVINGRFFAVGAEGTVLYSSDGLQWETASLPSGADLRDIAFGAGRYVAVGDGPVVLYSGDGEGWLEGGFAASGALNAVAYGNQRFVAVGGNESGDLWGWSADGISWTPVASPSSGQQPIDLVFSRGRFVAVMEADGATFASTDGEQWTAGDVLGFGARLTDRGERFAAAVSASSVLSAYSPDPFAFVETASGLWLITEGMRVLGSGNGYDWSLVGSLFFGGGPVTSIASDGAALLVGRDAAGHWLSTGLETRDHLAGELDSRRVLSLELTVADASADSTVEFRLEQSDGLGTWAGDGVPHTRQHAPVAGQLFFDVEVEDGVSSRFFRAVPDGVE